MTPSIAAPSGSKARLLERMDARVRAGPLGARSAGESSQPDVGETVMPGANGFGYFCRNKSSPFAREANGKRHGCRSSQCESGALRARPLIRRFAPPSPTRGEGKTGNTVARRRAPTKAAPRGFPSLRQALARLASLTRERGKERLPRVRRRVAAGKRHADLPPALA